MGTAEAESRRHCQSTRVEEMAKAAGRLVRAGRPRSRVASSHDVVAPKEVERYSCLFVFICGSSLLTIERLSSTTIGSFFLE